jgi:signal transduction histidine kinase/AraC-like DNA-binding protein/CheY-like chemotaxis protein
MISSPLALVGIVALALLLIAWSVSYRQLRALRKQERQLAAGMAELTLKLTSEKEETRRAQQAIDAQVKQLEELDKAKAQFFGNVAHECRTRLMMIIGPLEDLRDGLHGPLPSRVASEIQVSIRNAHRLLHLLNEMLEMVKIEAAQVELRPRRADLAGLIEGIADSFSRLAERKRIDFRVESPPGPIPLHFDQDVLEKIVVNLVANALKFTPNGGTVRLTAGLVEQVETDGGSGPEISVAVRDSGPGIAAEELPYIFERFYRVDKSGSPQPGTGIGLSLTKDLVDLHGGRVDVESEEGFGTKFEVRIPVEPADLAGIEELAVSAASDRMEETTADESEGGEIVDEAAGMGAAAHATVPDDAAVGEEDVTTVLLVEDDEDMRSYMRRHLASQYRVLEAEDGEAVTQDPELSYIPVILLTASADNEDKIEGLESGAHDYLFKPIEMKELRAKIKNLLDSRKRLLDRVGAEKASTDKTLHASPVEVVSADDALLQRIKSVIETHLGNEDFSVESLAEKVGLSRGHLHRRLRELLKQPPTDVIRTIRLERAAHLLEGRAGSVSEVAYATGFKSVAHFSKCFKDKYGHSPSQHIGASSSRI